jgi:hypothetical protein
MSILKDAITAQLGADVRFVERYQHPARTIFCIVPQEKFVDAAKAMKKAYALLAMGP